LSVKLAGLQGSNQGSESESLHSQLNAAGDREKSLMEAKAGVEQDLCEVQSRLKKMKEDNAMVREEWDLSDAALKVAEAKVVSLSEELELSISQVRDLSKFLFVFNNLDRYSIFSS
jgi:predicted nuclease with TOPRIM domain